MVKRMMGLAILFLILAAANGRAAPTEKTANGYLLNLYHFNIQYVVGDEGSMRRIITESFEPLVDFYLAHPEWGADFEMQGVMIEFMGQNYPAVLEKFKKIVNSGQVELVTFHYADQLLLAFPRHDQEWSLRLNDQLLEKYGIKRSGVIFTQEAQFGEGFAVIGKEHGYEIGVMTPGAYHWFQDDNRFPYFTVNGMEVLVNQDAVEPQSGIKVKWQFVGDGELVATGGFSPYFAGLFRKNPARLKVLEEQFKAALGQGYRPMKITAYVAALRAAQVQPSPAKPFLDSPWRPEDGSGVFQWMGKYVSSYERDYDIRTKNWQTRHVLIEAERAGAKAEVLAEAWGHLLNAEVSDPTGWYPLPVEIKFDYQEMDAALAALQKDPKLDLAALKKKAENIPECGEAISTPPLTIRKFGAAEKAAISWSKHQSIREAYCVTVSWSQQGARGIAIRSVNFGEKVETGSDRGHSGIAFPMTGDHVEYSPAMLEDRVTWIPLQDLKGKTIHLALTNGLIGLGNRTYLVRDNSAGVVAAGLYFQDRELRFEVQKGREPVSFRFYILTGVNAPEALAFANALNRVAP